MASSRHNTQPAPVALSPHGCTERGHFRCEARCFLPIGDTVWVPERSGHIVVRCARSGNELEKVDCHETFFATSIIDARDNSIWVACTDGKIRVFAVATRSLAAILQNPETQNAGEIRDMCLSGDNVFTAMTSCRVVQWCVSKRSYVRSFAHNSPVQTVSACGVHVVSGDASGVINLWDLLSGQLVGSNAGAKTRFGISCSVVDDAAETVWCGRDDGTIEVHCFSREAALDAPDDNPSGKLHFVKYLTDMKTKVLTLMCHGGKVFGGGVDKALCVWHAKTYQLLGKLKDHGGFISAMGRLYVMETARVWVASNDKTVRVFDAEGFFGAVRSEGENQELARAHNLAQRLKVDLVATERRLATASEKIMFRDDELERLRKEIQEQAMKTSALEHVVDMKEQAIHGNADERNRLNDEINTQNTNVGLLTFKLNKAEEEQGRLRGEVARAQEEASKAKAALTERTSQYTIADADRAALLSDKNRLQMMVEQKEGGLVGITSDLKQARDEMIIKDDLISKLKAEAETLKSRVVDMERSKQMLAEAQRATDEERKRLADMVIVRDNERKELSQQLNELAKLRNSQQQEVLELSKKNHTGEATSQKLQDSYLLRSHEVDLLRAEKEQILSALKLEKDQLAQAQTNERKLSLQNEELKKQLDQEKAAVKMLEDQYTIFQFVINSRGELVRSIWNLHSKLLSAGKNVKGLEQSLRTIDVTKEKLALKKEWKETVADKSHLTVESLGDVQRQTDYIIANYFSEYEKRHLGISTSKFLPDQQRQAVVGDQLLTKLRDVTLVKNSAAPEKPKVLPPPYQGDTTQSPSVPPSRQGHSVVPLPAGGQQQGYLQAPMRTSTPTNATPTSAPYQHSTTPL